MSLVSNLMMKLNAVSMASNAEMSWMTSANQMMQGIRQAGNPNLSFAGMQSLHEKEKDLQSNMIMADMRRQIGNAQAKSADKMLKDSIARSFDMYA